MTIENNTDKSAGVESTTDEDNPRQRMPAGAGKLPKETSGPSRSHHRRNVGDRIRRPDPDSKPDPDPESAQDNGDENTDGIDGLGRRSFVSGMAAAGASAGVIGSATPAAAEDTTDAENAESPVEATSPRVLNNGRFDDVFELRMDKAESLKQPMPEHHVVNDGAQHDGYWARYTKGLPHDEHCAVDPDVYMGYLEAVNSDDPDAWESVETGGPREFIAPLASTTMPMLGMDTHELAIDPPPELDSEQQAAELTELYWQALLRDVPFREYDESEIAQAAADDLSRFDEDILATPRVDGEITSDTLFRSSTPGSDVGPYVSQFFLKFAPMGAHAITQRIRTAEPGVDYITDRQMWLSNMNGTSLADNIEDAPETAEQAFDDTPRFMRTGRDLASCVQRDVIPGQFFLAVLVLTERPVDGIPPNTDDLYDDRNPYAQPGTAHGFVNYARSAFLDLLTRASRLGLMSAWFNKWAVHRRCRPEKLGGLIDMARNDNEGIDSPFHESLFDSDVFDRVESEQDNALLSQAYAEGAPTHPAYPGGHAVSSAAAGTVLKAVFNEDYEIPEPVVASADGTERLAYDGGETLTVETEVNKLVENVNIGGRQFAGVHYRSDAEAAYQLGEEVAIRLLKDVKEQTAEAAGFEFTSFTGSSVSI